MKMEMEMKGKKKRELKILDAVRESVPYE